MGAVAEVVRTRPGARRSGHPHRSFAAYGPAADALLARHDLDDPVGEGSPLAALYAADAQALLLGVGYDKCTSLHLAEARSGLPVTRVPNGAPVLDDGQRRWVTFDEPAVDDTDFVALGQAFAAEGGERAGQVGDADARLVDVRALVDFAAPWFARTRRARAGT
jgi:aminoglycoside 3-N-acetyltransferase